jgi:hypothetical protein
MIKIKYKGKKKSTLSHIIFIFIYLQFNHFTLNYLRLYFVLIDFIRTYSDVKNIFRVELPFNLTKQNLILLI